MIEFMHRAQKYANLPVQIFKPSMDDRGEGRLVVKAKTGEEFPATAVDDPQEILQRLIVGVKVVGIDEAQFMAAGVIGIVKELSVGMGLTVVVAGLPTDFKNDPFGPMPGLIAMADSRIECYAICMHEDGPDRLRCGGKATRTQRLRSGGALDQVVVVGGEDLYEPRCPLHHVVLE